jgi:hypothetical protein
MWPDMHEKPVPALRPTALALVILILPAAGCSTVIWEPSLQTGLEKSARTGKPALVQVHAAANADCLDMDANVFTDEDVATALEEFIPIRVDYFLSRSVADRLGVEVLPTFFVFRTNGTIAGSHAGNMNVSQFKSFLMSCRYY